jgi:nucleoside-diphosphate-sugar epimerase
MHRVVVTGGSGKAGRAVVADLTERGYDVVNVDVSADPDPDAPTRIADLTDLGETFDVLAGADSVIHLAAIPAPNIMADGETFRINMMSTYNVFSAATRLGLDRIVWASSETLIGIPFQRTQPAYAPIDEAHPRLPEFHYALSKLAGEVIAEQFTRWTGTPIVSLRISNIMEPHDYARFPSFWDDPSIRSWNLWGYVDARDVAQAARRALEADTQGSEAYLVAAADTCMTTPSRDLMAQVFPDVPLREGIDGHTTLLSIDKARRDLGYAPEHTWRMYVDETN